MKSDYGAQNLTTHSAGATGAQSGRGRFAAWRGLPVRAAAGGAFLLVALAVSLLLSSCGSHDTRSAADPSSSGAAAAQPLEQRSVAPSQGQVAQAASQVGAQGGERVEAKPESQPPDVSVTATDTLVTPGETVELIAQATMDVSNIVLWDGIRDRQPFAYDSAAKAWRATYRVPLKPALDRLGLSVTARNDANRWRRVWVFLTIDRESQAKPDSGSGTY